MVPLFARYILLKVKVLGQRREIPKWFSSVTPPYLVRFTSSTNHNVPILGAGIPVVSCTADFLVLTVLSFAILNFSTGNSLVT